MKKLPDHLTYDNTMAVGRPVDVYLDEVEQRGVLEAHVSEGWVLLVVEDEAGNIAVTGDPRDPDVETIKKHGVVRIVERTESWDA